MEPFTMIVVYGLAFIAGLGVLTILSGFTLIQNLFFRTFAGGSAGGITAYYLSAFSPTIQFLEVAVTGGFGMGGYLFLLSMLVLISVWGWNIFRYNGQVVR